MKRRQVGLVAALGLACSANLSSTPAPVETPSSLGGVETPRKEADVQDAFEAVVRVEPQREGTGPQGLWLDRDDGARWSVADRPAAWLLPFDGERVHVTGGQRSADAQGQAEVHFRIHTLRVVDIGASKAALVEVGPERRLTGKFTKRIAAEGTKLAGEEYIVFEPDEGGSFLLAKAPGELPLARTCTITARTVTPSPYVARRGGPFLWVLAVEPGG